MMRRIALLTSILAALLGPGCSRDGAKSTDSAGSTTPHDKPPTPFDVPRSASLPGSWERPQVFIKPGHWTAAWFEAASNDADYRGDLVATLVDGDEQALSIAPSRRRLSTRRPIVLPRREPRVVEHSFFAPNVYPRKTPEAAIDPGPLAAARCRLQLASYGSSIDHETSVRATALRNHQAIFAVLAARPAEYRFLAKLDVVVAPNGPFEPGPDETHFRLVLADDPARSPLPGNVLAWTNTAYVLWDGYDASLLTAAQRQALIDWLHWGGRLIVSGPDSLRPLGREFLSPYLPAVAGDDVSLTADDLRALSDSWTPPRCRTLEASQPWPGIDLKPTPQAETTLVAAGGKPLVVTRRVGRGYVIVAAFRLNRRELIDWPSYDVFLHGCLMRRPPRTVRAADDSDAFAFQWADNDALDSRPWFDPRRICDVRFAVRDDGRSMLPAGTPAEAAASYLGHASIGPGVGAWRDDGPIVDGARAVLRGDAGLVVPSPYFVTTVVLAYFFVLVPLNWIVFRSLGRPHWAWFAAPLIAAGFALLIVRLAELDVGFVRSGYETTIVEFQPDFRRAHCTRFVAVYNSLGTKYRVGSDEPTTLILPFSADAKPNDADPDDLLNLRCDELARTGDAGANAVALDGFVVGSNGAGLLRAEQMLDCGGAIRCEPIDGVRYRITNDSRLELRNVRIVGRLRGDVERIGPEAGVVVTLTPHAAGPKQADRPDSSAVASLTATLAAYARDELRLVAETPTELPGLKLDPAPSERRTTTIVVAHLQYDDVPVRRDVLGRDDALRRPAPDP